MLCGRSTCSWYKGLQCCCERELNLPYLPYCVVLWPYICGYVHMHLYVNTYTLSHFSSGLQWPTGLRNVGRRRRSGSGRCVSVRRDCGKWSASAGRKRWVACRGRLRPHQTGTCQAGQVHLVAWPHRLLLGGGAGPHRPQAAAVGGQACAANPPALGPAHIHPLCVGVRATAAAARPPWAAGAHMVAAAAHHLTVAGQGRLDVCHGHRHHMAGAAGLPTTAAARRRMAAGQGRPAGLQVGGMPAPMAAAARRPMGAGMFPQAPVAVRLSRVKGEVKRGAGCGSLDVGCVRYGSGVLNVLADFGCSGSLRSASLCHCSS